MLVINKCFAIRYNVAVIGPALSGKKTFSLRLSEEYGWKLVDVQKIIGEVLIAQRQQEIEVQTHIPSTFDPRINDVHLSVEEWKEFAKVTRFILKCLSFLVNEVICFFQGNPISAKEVWPIVLHKLGVALQKKPENWGVEKNENEEEEDEETKRLAEEAAKKAKKAPKKKEVKEKPKDGEEERPHTPAPEEL